MDGVAGESALSAGSDSSLARFLSLEESVAPTSDALRLPFHSY